LRQQGDRGTALFYTRASSVAAAPRHLPLLGRLRFFGFASE